MTAENHTDRDLLERVAEGDEAAFGQLFHRYHHLLGHHIYRLTENRQMAEEIVQDVFVKIWTIREGLSEVNDFRGWLFTIAKNQSLNALRKAARMRVKQKQWEKDLAPDPEMEEEADAWQDLIEKAIDELPAQQKKVYVLSRQEGLTYQQIADRMQLRHETVKYYMKLAIASITKQIKKEAGLLVTLMLLSRF